MSRDSNIVIFYLFQPRKRQIMFSVFGDYRRKMQEDFQKTNQGNLRMQLCKAILICCCGSVLDGIITRLGYLEGKKDGMKGGREGRRKEKETNELGISQLNLSFYSRGCNKAWRLSC